MSSQRGFSSDADPAQPFDEHTPWIFFVPGDPSTRELPGNPGDGEIRKTPFLPRLARGMYNFATMQFLPLSYRALWQEVDVVM